ncbi:ferredoxin [Streptomyces endophyticus]|uniref:Ferredoxin n=1 Tax=Streptomyces endophyticus TaxID=714166 RepID=A0ABU6FBJ3_9ACTN|nr:ferredoxin [Streptomyces endophyticus]MEB8341411.1 ferredoxin [Streptomyces endophyticus]
MTQRWDVAVDPRMCVRTGLCVASLPSAFERDEQGQGRARTESSATSEEVLEIAESCPVEAISIVDTESGKPVFPPE